MSFAPGTEIPGYRVESLLGEGGMGQVYMAIDLRLGRPVALKVIVPSLAESSDFRERFLAESRLAASLDHPHVVPVYEAGEHDGRLYLAMRFVDGADLGAILADGGPLEPARAIRLLAGVAAALDAAHAKGLVHRDVKPSNILVAGAGGPAEHPYLGDFGLVRDLSRRGGGATSIGQFVGSADYAAPEHIEGRALDGRADIYSLAAVLFHLVAGRPPFAAGSEIALLWAHLHAGPPALSAEQPALAALDPVIARGMAKDPAERFATAAELVGAAAAVLDGTAATLTLAPRPGEPSLPRVPTPTIGREHEIDELVDLVGRSGIRLVSILGPGGIGKTRLALSVAHRMRTAFADGVRFVDLSPILDPDSVPRAIAQAVGQGEDPAETIGDQELLLVLDNFEQVMAAAGTVARLLDRCPNLTVIATSRIRLELRAEHDHHVPPLDHDEAVALFEARARAIDESFTSDRFVSEICDRLDRMPLAIELAAARVNVLSPASILGRLDKRLAFLTTGPRDMPARQQTLRATIQWSFDLLDASARQLLARLSIFAGGFELDAAEDVAEADLDTLGALVEHNLVRREGGRYRLLDTIREFAADQLDPAERARMAMRHARHFAGLVRRALDEGNGRQVDDEAWLRRFGEEDANLVAALSWHAEEGTGEPLLAFAMALYSYWLARGLPVEGEHWAAAAIERNPDADPRVLLWVMLTRSEYVRFAGEDERAIALKLDLVARARSAGVPQVLAASLNDLGGLYLRHDRRAEARAAVEEGLVIRRQLGNPRGVAHALGGVADVEVADGNYEKGLQLLEESAALSDDMATINRVENIHSLANVRRLMGQLEAADALYVEAYERARSLDYRAGLAEALLGLASTRAASAPAIAATLRGAGLAIAEHAGYSINPSSGTEPFDAPAAAELEAVTRGRTLTLAEIDALVAGSGSPEALARPDEAIG
jgi:non-specific serine/threonine protein kinase